MDLQTKRISLRPMVEADTDKVIAWRNSDLVMKRFIYRIPLTRETHLNWFHNKVETGKVVQFIVTVNETGREIGSTYLQNIDLEKKEAEFGIFLGEEAALGKGYGTEAQGFTIWYAFEKMGMESIVTRVLEDNPASIAVQEKLGFLHSDEDAEDVVLDGEKKKVIFFHLKKENFKWVKN